MKDYCYFWMGFALVGILCLIPFLKLIWHAKEIGGWEKTYFDEEHKKWDELNWIIGIDEFYSGDKAENYVGEKWLLEKKAYLLSRVNELDKKKDIAESMIPLFIGSILPEVITVFFLGMDDAPPKWAFIVAIVFLVIYSIAVIVIGFELVSIMLKSKTSDVIRDEYELKCIDKLIDRHFENV